MRYAAILGISALSALTLAGPAVGQLPPMGVATEILKPRDFPGWQSQNVCYPFVFRESDGSYKMYYSGSASEQWNDSNWDQWVSGYVTSSDTISWKFPDNYEQVLFARKFMEGDLVDPVEIAAQFDSVYAVAPCIIKDGSIYKVWYTGWNGETVHRGGGISDKINFRIGHATSTDGIAWAKVVGSTNAGAVLGLGATGEYDSKGAACPYVLKEGSNYRMWYEGYDGTTRRILYAESSDGITWIKHGVALDKGGDNALDELGLSSPMVIRRSNRYELWYEGQGKSAPNYRILRATSDNGITWTKVSTPVAMHSNPAVSGSEHIHVRSAIVQADNKVQVFFAKQATAAKEAEYCILRAHPDACFTEPVGQSRRYSIYTEIVNP